MTTLVALLSTGKGTWRTVYSIIRAYKWEKVVIITNDFGKEKFNEGSAELLSFDLRKPPKELSAEIRDALKNRIADAEVALNISSGTGEEHMAVISALIGAGVGIRFVSWDSTNEKLTEVTPNASFLTEEL